MAIKAVIDTNIWVSALLNPHGYPAQLRKAFEAGSFLPVVSAPMLEEMIDVLNRPRIKDKYDLTSEEIEELVILIEERSEHVLLEGKIALCRDKDDDMILETALNGKAKYLVTRDNDIKFDKQVSSFLKQYDISVKTVAQFMDALNIRSTK